jgi:hypothetical protein
MDCGVLGGFFGFSGHSFVAAALHKVVAAELRAAPDWKKLRGRTPDRLVVGSAR